MMASKRSSAIWSMGKLWTVTSATKNSMTITLETVDSTRFNCWLRLDWQTHWNYFILVKRIRFRRTRKECSWRWHAMTSSLRKPHRFKNLQMMLPTKLNHMEQTSNLESQELRKRSREATQSNQGLDSSPIVFARRSIPAMREGAPSLANAHDLLSLPWSPPSQNEPNKRFSYRHDGRNKSKKANLNAGVSNLQNPPGNNVDNAAWDSWRMKTLNRQKIFGV